MEKETSEDELCHYSGLPSPLTYGKESKQETFEEAKSKFSNNPKKWLGISREDLKNGWDAGAEWQQERMYNEEDMNEAFSQGWVTRERFDDLSPDIIYPKGLDYEEKQEYAFNLWFQKFKKK
jgi:hypothetical protein